MWRVINATKRPFEIYRVGVIWRPFANITNFKESKYRPKVNPADEIRTEFKSFLSIGMKSGDYSQAIKHAIERLSYNVVDNGKSVNGKLVATILNVYCKSGEFDKAFDLFNSIRHSDHKDHTYYKHLRLSSFHYQLILDACKEKKATSITSTSETNNNNKTNKARYQIAYDILLFMINKNKEAVAQKVKCKTPLPTAVHFTSVIDSCLLAKKFELAYEVFLIASM